MTLVGVLLGLLAVAAPASAHPFLLFTDPAFDSAVAEAPPNVALVFNEGVTVAPDAVLVTDLQGRTVGSGEAKTARGGTAVTAPLPTKLSPGSYLVRWEVTGVDGHGTGGEFRFTIGAAVHEGRAAQTTEAEIGWGAGALRWGVIIGFVLAVGGIIGRRLTAQAIALNPQLPRIPSWALPSALIGLVATVASAGLLAARSGSLEVLWQTRPGIALIASGGGFVLGIAAIAAKRPTVALLPLGAVAVAEGAVSHTNIEVPFLGALLTSVHLVAVALWVGGLLVAAVAIFRWRNWRPACWWIAARYARMAVWVFVAVTGTGLVMALILVPPSALTSTIYGQVLLVKLAIVTVVALLAMAGRASLHRRSERVFSTMRVEAGVLGVVLVVSAVLVVAPTPRYRVAEAPPPPAAGLMIPAGGMAGQIGVNVVASEGQVVVRLTTPRDTDYYNRNDKVPDFELTGNVAGEPLDFRACGGGCFVAPVAWPDDDAVLSLRAHTEGWRGGTFAATIPGSATPGEDLVREVVQTMGSLGQFILYETSSSDSRGSTEPKYLVADGPLLLSNEPYNSGTAPIAVTYETEGQDTRLLMGFPAARVFVDLTLDDRGRIVRETMATSKIINQRTFVY